MVVDGFTASDHSSASRLQLTRWLNAEFELCVTDLQQCGTGAIYMQIIDKLMWTYQALGEGPPIPMHRVRWDTVNPVDFAENFKLLQTIFIQYNIKKTIPVQQLSRMRMQDNLAFVQFLQNLYNRYYQPDDSYPGGWARRMASTHGNFKPWAVCPGEGAENEAPHAPPRRIAFSKGPTTSVPNAPNLSPANPSRFQPTMKPRQKAPMPTQVQGYDQSRIADLSAKVAEYERVMQDADRDIELLNEERAKYYTQLLAIEKIRRVREEKFGGDIPCITPNEVLACIDGINYPEDIQDCAPELDYKLYLE